MTTDGVGAQFLSIISLSAEDLCKLNHYRRHHLFAVYTSITPGSRSILSIYFSWSPTCLLRPKFKLRSYRCFSVISILVAQSQIEYWSTEKIFRIISHRH